MTAKLFLSMCFLSIGFSITTFAADTVAVDASKCKKMIQFLPQIHSQHDDYAISKSNNLESIAKSQYKIAKYISARSAEKIPVFQEGVYSTMGSDLLKSRMNDQILMLQNQSNQTLSRSYDQLSKDEKVSLAENSGAQIALIAGKIDKIFPTTPSERIGQERLDQIRAYQTTHSTINNNDTEAIDLIFRDRDKWALNQVINYFNTHPESKEAILVFGASHVFDMYDQMVPGLCIGIPPQFAEFIGDTEYPINSTGLKPLN